MLETDVGIVAPRTLPPFWRWPVRASAQSAVCQIRLICAPPRILPNPLPAAHTRRERVVAGNATPDCP